MIYITGVRAPYGQITEDQITMYRWSTSKQDGGSIIAKDQFIKREFSDGQVYSYNPKTTGSERLLVDKDKNEKDFLKTYSKDKETWLDKLPRV
jgi:hypothetical protein